LTACAAAGGALAQEGMGVDACRSDVEQFCKDVERGQGRIARCLRQNESKLSVECKQQLARARDRMRAMGEACQPDIREHCKDERPGRARITRCLERNESVLAGACKDAIAKVRALREEGK
jgi:Golgi apparatus protein 1